MPIQKSKSLLLKCDLLVELKGEEESVTGRPSYGRTQVHTSWLTTLFWDVSSSSRGLLLVTEGSYQTRITLYATTAPYLRTCPWTQKSPVLFPEVNNYGLDVHQSHSKFEILRSGMREVLLFRFQRKNEFILKNNIYYSRRYSRNSAHTCWKGNARNER